MTKTSRTSRGKGYAGEGGVRQHGGSLPVYVCNTCGSEVVWAESKRTGRKYLVNVSYGQKGQRFYMGHNVHPSDCTLADREREAVLTYSRNVAAAFRDLLNAYRAGELDRDTFVEASLVVSDMSDNTPTGAQLLEAQEGTK